jgi:riboflavin biosynthesis pyrimidine reductase
MQLLLPRSSDGPDSPLVSEQASQQADVHAHYARNWLDAGGVRVNFVTSADGAASAKGLSRALQTPGDNVVFAALRDLADVILVGASTAAAEGYRPSKPSSRRQALRESFGLSAAPAIAVMSAGLELDLSAPLYAEAEAAPTLVITGSSAPVGRRNDIIDLAGTRSRLQLIEAPSSAAGGVDFGAAVTSLRELGYHRILCEGGPRLFGAGVAAGAVDELCLTYSPVLAGPGSPRIIGGEPWPEAFAPRLELVGLLAEDGALFARYLLSR